MISEPDSKRITIFLCDPSDWQRVLAAEYAFSQESTKRKTVLFDIEFVGENLTKELLKKLGVRSKFKKTVISNLRKEGYEFFSPSVMQIITNKLRSLKVVRLPKYITNSDTRFTLVYPTLVNMTGFLVIPSHNFKKLVAQELRKSQALEKYLQAIDLSTIDEAIIVNGRFTKAMTLRMYLARYSIDVKTLEFASTQEKYEIFKTSPHSNNEMGEKMRTLWREASIHNRHQIAERYFQTLQNLDPSAGISWNESMIPGRIPVIPSGKRVLTFYSSSESEFVGVRDKIPFGLFQNQAEALKSILEITSPKEWIVFLRRHPKRPGSQTLDVEEHIWTSCREFPHLIEIHPSSEIDSYQLGLESEVVAHFDSSIGPQLIRMGHHRVITLGNTIWEYLDGKHHIRSRGALEEFIANPTDHCPDINPWGYFRAEYGQPIQRFKLKYDDMTWEWLPDPKVHQY